MKVAVLAPLQSGSVQEHQAELLVPGLIERGLEVETIGTHATAEREAHALARLFDRAATFDLAHNLLGARVLPACLLLDLPVVTPVFGPLAEDERSLYRLFSERTHYVATSQTVLAEAEMRFAGVIRPAARSDDAPRMAGEFVELYGRLLAAEGRRRADTRHDTRPWGEYRVLEDAPAHKVKRIDVLPGKRLSYQCHARRSEHWVVVAGSARVTLDGIEHRLSAGDSIDVPAGTAHRIENVGDQPMTFVEVQHGSYFGEDDIVRLEDDFGRG